MGEASNIEQAWRRLSAEMSAHFAQGKSPDEMIVLAEAKEWTVKLQTEVRETSGYYSTKQRFSWMQAHYVSKDGFRFEIYRRGPFSNLWLKLLRMRSVELGYPEFGHDFIVKGNDESKVRRLFANARIRHLIQSQPSIHLQAREDRLHGSLVQGVSVLYCDLGLRVITDVERLKSLIELFEETLDHLCEMESASAGGPMAQDLRASVEMQKKDPEAVERIMGWRIAGSLGALDELQKLDPEAADRIVRAIDSGGASTADLPALVARARQDALTVDKAEARLRAEGRLPPREVPPSEEA